MSQRTKDNGERAEYIACLNRMQMSITFKARSKMLEVKHNYSNKSTEIEVTEGGHDSCTTELWGSGLV